MKKSEFDEKYKEICLTEFENFVHDEDRKKEILECQNENGNIAYEKILVYFFTKSIEFSMKCTKKVLEELIEFDD